MDILLIHLQYDFRYKNHWETRKINFEQVLHRTLEEKNKQTSTREF
jgi:hypothetical protein